jgi:hypothetical protein
MRKALIVLVALVMIFAAAPAFAQNYTEMGTFSIGLGGGFGDSTDVGPFILSGKYWDPMWELGAEVYWSGDTEDEYDQIGMAWLAYRYDLSVEEENAIYAGIGGAGVFEDYDFGNQFGPIGMIGWDATQWGLEFKWAWFDPSVLSLVAYYHFAE